MTRLKILSQFVAYVDVSLRTLKYQTPHKYINFTIFYKFTRIRLIMKFIIRIFRKVSNNDDKHIYMHACVSQSHRRRPIHKEEFALIISQN